MLSIIPYVISKKTMPLSSLEAVLKYTSNKISQNKLVLGLPLQGGFGSKAGRGDGTSRAKKTRG